MDRQRKEKMEKERKRGQQCGGKSNVRRKREKKTGIREEKEKSRERKR